MSVTTPPDNAPPRLAAAPRPPREQPMRMNDWTLRRFSCDELTVLHHYRLIRHINYFLFWWTEPTNDPDTVRIVISVPFETTPHRPGYYYNGPGGTTLEEVSSILCPLWAVWDCVDEIPLPMVHYGEPDDPLPNVDDAVPVYPASPPPPAYSPPPQYPSSPRHCSTRTSSCLRTSSACRLSSSGLSPSRPSGALSSSGSIEGLGVSGIPT